MGDMHLSPLSLHMPDADDLKPEEYAAVLDLKPASLLCMNYAAWPADKGAAAQVVDLVQKLGHTDLYVRFHADPDPIAYAARFGGPVSWARLCASRMTQYYGALATSGVRLHAILANEVDADSEGDLGPEHASAWYEAALYEYSRQRLGDLVHVPATTGAPDTHRRYLTQYKNDGWVRSDFWLDGHGYNGDLGNVCDVLEELFPNNYRMITETNDVNLAAAAGMVGQRAHAIAYFILLWAHGGEGRVLPPSADDAAKQMSLMRFPDRYAEFKATIPAPIPVPEPEPTPPVPEPEPLPPGTDPWQWWDALTIAAASGCPVQAVTDNWPAIVREMQAVGIWSQDDAIASIGTIAIETASTFLPIHEYGTRADWAGYDGGADYAGRGHAQLTHRYNYQSCGDKIGLDLVGTPDLLLQTDPSAKSFAWFYSTHGVPSKDGSHYYTLAELADEPDYYWFRVAWSGASRGADRMQLIRDSLLGATVPASSRLYIDDVPDEVVLQQNDWTCSVRSTYAALWAIWQVAGGSNPEPTYGDGGPNDVYDWMVPSICDSSVGLHAADGHELVALLNAKGYPSTVITSASLSDAQRVAGTTPLLLGGAAWYHWVMVKGVEPDGSLILENPAPGYKGIGSELRDSWDALGPMTLITVHAMAAAPPVPVPPTSTYAVGEGLLAAMTARGDEPSTDEIYFGTGGQYSEALGISGTRYVWIKSANAVHTYPPAA